MSKASWDERWRERLRKSLETDLLAPDPARELSTTQGVPFAIFVYWPADEREARQEIERLARRLEHGSPRKVHILLISQLVDEAIRTAAPPDGQALFDGERDFAHLPVEQRLEELRDQMAGILASLPDLIMGHFGGLSKDTDIVFLTRVGALYPAYRVNSLLDQLMGQLLAPTILFYPGQRSGTNSLNFMNSLQGKLNYRYKVY